MKMLPPVTQKLSPINSYMLRFVTSKALVMTQFFFKFRIKFNVQLYANLKIYSNIFKITDACSMLPVAQNVLLDSRNQEHRSFTNFKKFFQKVFIETD